MVLLPDCCAGRPWYAVPVAAKANCARSSSVGARAHDWQTISPDCLQRRRCVPTRRNEHVGRFVVRVRLSLGTVRSGIALLAPRAWPIDVSIRSTRPIGQAWPCHAGATAWRRLSYAPPRSGRAGRGQGQAGMHRPRPASPARLLPGRCQRLHRTRRSSSFRGRPRNAASQPDRRQIRPVARTRSSGTASRVPAMRGPRGKGLGRVPHGPRAPRN
jgi:hypothetical protein